MASEINWRYHIPEMHELGLHPPRGANHKKIKFYNECLVLSTISARQPLSQGEIAEQTGLQSSTTSIIIDRLLGVGILKRTLGERSGRPGRRSRPLVLDPGYRHVVGVALAPREHVIAVGNFNGEIVATGTVANSGDPYGDLNALAGQIRRLRSSHSVPIGAIGISCPGTVDATRTRLAHSAVLGWRDIDLGCLSNFEDCPTYVDHDARLGALAEIWRRNGDYPQNFAYLLVQEGLGVGFVISGQVYRGKRHHGSEFGHVTLDPRGPHCPCGRRGCWETYVCAKAILDRYSHHAGGAKCSSLADLVERALGGDRVARKALTATGFFLARGIATMSWALSVDEIIVGGELSQAWPILEPAVRGAFDRNPLPIHVEQLPITVSRFGASGPLRGAIALALGRYIPGLPQLGFGSDARS